MSLMRGEQAIAAALASIEVTPDAYRTTAKWMAESIGFDRVGHGIELYRRTLGEPLETTAEQGLEPGSGFARSLRHRFRLTLWRAMDFIVQSHPDGWAWRREFVRRRRTCRGRSVGQTSHRHRHGVPLEQSPDGQGQLHRGEPRCGRGAGDYREALKSFELAALRCSTTFSTTSVPTISPSSMRNGCATVRLETTTTRTCRISKRA